jgi:hypothetical protein
MYERSFALQSKKGLIFVKVVGHGFFSEYTLLLVKSWCMSTLVKA